MADDINNNDKNTEVVDAESLGKASNSVSRFTLVMIAGTVILAVIAAIFISRIFSQPTGGGGSGSGSSNATRNVSP